MKYILWLITLFALGNAQIHKTMCYVENWATPSSVESIKLNGGECKGQKSIKDLLQEGWKVDDIITSETKKGVNYMYIMQKDVQEAIVQKVLRNPEILIKTNKRKESRFKPQYFEINNVTNKTATINIGNLKVGQSGVIAHRYADKHTMIIASASIIESSSSQSTIKLSNFNGLSQSALPKSSIKAAQGDIFILNYLYTSSLLIAPNYQSFKTTRNIYTGQNFIHSDTLATNLKLLKKSTPTQPIIQAFCKNQNIGTIYVVIDNTVNIIDARTFKVLAQDPIFYNYDDTQIPFYTRVQDIEDGVFSLDFIGLSSDPMKDYSDYYSKLLGL
ncbi:MAG: plasminogen-binding N-terminal domain-containing protein [Campylobacterota bacterium]|nr:plasminogen-binding N-terminal domain-containing protein [Campylobacterota bacterium]